MKVANCECVLSLSSLGLEVGDFFVIHIFNDFLFVRWVALVLVRARSRRRKVVFRSFVVSRRLLCSTTSSVIIIVRGGGQHSSVWMYGCIPRADDGHSLDFAVLRPPLCVVYCRLCCVYKCGCVSAWLAKEKRNEAEEKAFMSKPSINIMMGQEVLQR